MLIASALWIGILTMLNVRERQSEIGIMKALGFGSSYITYIFIGRSLIIGLIGAIMGFIIGTALSILFGPNIFSYTANNIKPLYGLFLWFIFISPIFTALSSLIPIIIAITKDPAITLTKE